MFVAFVGDFQARPTFTVPTGPNQDSTLAVADLGAGRAWRIALEPLPNAARPLMCLEQGHS
ncbi:MAG TPA: hypothetical protein VGQ98_08355 [Gemmatimonadaceae bacterium]|nr:hypothetical protein [Gemmatimonadaceae bacterium]